MQKRRGRSVGPLSLMLIASSVPVAAQAGEGFYAGLAGGGNFVEDQKYRLDDSNVFGKSSFKDGWAAGLVFGYAIGGLRPELEVLHRQNDFDGFHLASTGALNPARDATDVDGKQSAQTVMANLWLDMFQKSRVRPYAGIGLGAARIAVDDVGYNAGGLLNPRVEFGDDDLTSFAYQVGAGVGFDLGEHLSLSLDYRYLQTQRKKIDLNSDTSRFAFKYETQTALLTLRYAFGGPAEPPPPPAAPVNVVPVVEAAPPPPPPPPAPPPCESPKPGQPFSLEGCQVGQTLVLHGVNFEFDKSRLTANAKTLLDLVADALLARQDIQVEIAGHTDSKGADAYNQKLSESRADAVKLYLIERGIDGSRMSTVGHGETQPVADNATDEGRELNRRVELRVTGSNPAAGPAPTVASPVPEGDVPPPPAEPAPAL